MNNDDVKSANRKALPRFILLTLISTVIGGVVERPVPFIVAVAAFIAVMVETIIIQQRCVDAVKRMNPEKIASVYDVKFQRKWMDSCDEAEKLMIGKCAYKAYAAANTACAVLAIIFAVCALIFNTGFLPSFAVCVIWFVLQFIYYRETIRYSKAGNRIS